MAQKAFADSYANYFSYTEKHKYHLREVGLLGSQEALLVLAKRFGDSEFFEQGHHKTVAQPAKVAAIAEDLGRLLQYDFATKAHRSQFGLSLVSNLKVSFCDQSRKISKWPALRDLNL